MNGKLAVPYQLGRTNQRFRARDDCEHKERPVQRMRYRRSKNREKTRHIQWRRFRRHGGRIKHIYGEGGEQSKRNANGTGNQTTQNRGNAGGHPLS